MSCYNIKLRPGENRYEAIFHACPIIQFDKFLAEKDGQDTSDYLEITKDITNSAYYTGIQ